MARTILIGAVAVATVTVGLLVAFRWRVPTPVSDQSNGQTNAVSPAARAVDVNTVVSPLEEEPAGKHPLQAYLLSAAAESRDSVLLSMIRDAGFSCTELVSTIQMTDETAAWRISCAGAQPYVVGVDSFGELRIEPLSYSEGLRPNNATPQPDLER
jgi:hypothetical protein